MGRKLCTILFIISLFSSSLLANANVLLEDQGFVTTGYQDHCVVHDLALTNEDVQILAGDPDAGISHNDGSTELYINCVTGNWDGIDDEDRAFAQLEFEKTFKAQGDLNNALVQFKGCFDIFSDIDTDLGTQNEYVRFYLTYIYYIQDVSDGTLLYHHSEDYINNYEKQSEIGEPAYFHIDYKNVDNNHLFRNVNFEKDKEYQMVFVLYLLVHSFAPGGKIYNDASITYNPSRHDVLFEIRWEDRQTNTPSKPSGPKVVKEVPVTCTYTTSTTDPDSAFSDDEKIYYQWSFGGVKTEWIGPYESGAQASIDHTWESFVRDEQGNFIPKDVSVKAKGSLINAYESEWSGELPVSRPYVKDTPLLKIRLNNAFQRFPAIFRILEILNLF